MGLNVAVIGLGSMGYGMAQSILRAGHSVWGRDINREAEERFRAGGGEKGPLAEDRLDAVVVVVLDAAQTRDVLFGSDGLVGRLRQGAVVLGCATVAPDFARDMEARCGEAGVLYLDAPVSGGPRRLRPATCR